MPQYLEMSMRSFTTNQDRMREYMQSTFGFNPFVQFEEVGKQNMAMLEKAMKMFTPFAIPGEAQPERPDVKPPVAPVAGSSNTEAASLDELRRKLAELQNQVNQLGKKV